jgi:diguanylate cyclase (GGDEF)-like protein
MATLSIEPLLCVTVREVRRAGWRLDRRDGRVLHVGEVGDLPADEATGADWVLRAQEGQAEEVLAEVGALLAGEIPALVRVRAQYAQATALNLLGRADDAVRVVRALIARCRDLGLAVTGLRARALLANLLHCSGTVGPALEELARALAIGSGLTDLDDPEVQVALGTLALALRMSGMDEEGRRIGARLAEVETRLPGHQRVVWARDLAFERAVEAMAASRRPPFEPDVAGLREAVDEIPSGERLAGDGGYPVAVDDAAVLAGLLSAVAGDPQEAVDRLRACSRVLRRGREAVTARNLWACALVHALLRLGRPQQALSEGHRLLREIECSSYRADRLALAFEVMRAEEAALGLQALGIRTYLAQAEERMQVQAAQAAALFRTRVSALRTVDERRALARAARLDSLTGLVNRRGAAVAVAEAAGRPDAARVALLLVDIDGLGRVNDQCGHLAGDVTLQRVAAALRAQTRSEDVVARWSGDEYLVLATVEAAAAVALGDRIREAVREGGGPTAEDAVTVSVGVAVRAGPVDDGEWLRRAEFARYMAWRDGGDATRLA